MVNCTKCGASISEDSKFCVYCGLPIASASAAGKCTSCGTPISEDNSFCVMCGLPVDSEQPPRICGNCGAPLGENLRFCGDCGTPVTVSRQQTPLPPIAGRGPVTPQYQATQTKQVPKTLAISTILAGIGAACMLLSMGTDWYAWRVGGMSIGISAGDLLTDAGDADAIWALFSLPLILIIVFASIALLSVAHSLAKKSKKAGLWIFLGILSGLSVIVNTSYMTWWIYDNTDEWGNLLNTGSVFALVGAIILLISGIGATIRK